MRIRRVWGVLNLVELSLSCSRSIIPVIAAAAISLLLSPIALVVVGVGILRRRRRPIRLVLALLVLLIWSLVGRLLVWIVITGRVRGIRTVNWSRRAIFGLWYLIFTWALPRTARFSVFPARSWVGGTKGMLDLATCVSKPGTHSSYACFTGPWGGLSGSKDLAV